MAGQNGNENVQQADTKDQTEPRNQWIGDPTQLTGFDAYGIATLSDGQRVNVHIQGRHGMDSERMYADFMRFIGLLDLCAVDAGVRFLEGSIKDSKTAAPKQETKAPAEPQEPEYVYADNESGATRLVVEYKSGKPYYKVEGVRGTKYPVTVWPEVLEAAGIVPESVDVKEGLDLKGWIVAFTKFDKDGNEGKYPTKITSMEGPSF